VDELAEVLSRARAALKSATRRAPSRLYRRAQSLSRATRDPHERGLALLETGDVGLARGRDVSGIERQGFSCASAQDRRRRFRAARGPRSWGISGSRGGQRLRAAVQTDGALRVAGP